MGDSCACPRCGYDLSGQVATWTEACPMEGVCPECGLGVRWAAILRPTLDPPAWSFEHAPAPMPAFVRAMPRTLRPWRLWRRLTMEHPLEPSRLVIALAVLGIALWGWFGLVNVWMAVGLLGTRMGAAHGIDYAATVLHPERPVSSALPPLVYYRLAPTLVGVVLLPCAFLLLHATLARARVRRAHLMRIAAYSLAPVAPCVVAMAMCRAIALVGTQTIFFGIGTPSSVMSRLDRFATSMDDRPYVWPALLAAWFWLFWWTAARRYLRLPNAGLVVGLMLAITSLAAALVCGFWPGSPLFTEIDAFFRGWV